MHKLLRAVDAANRASARASSWLILVIVGALVYEVVARYGFRKPTMWSFDVTYMACSLFVAFGLGYTLQTRGHVLVDVVYNRLSQRTRSLIYVVMYLVLFFPCWVLLIHSMLPYVIRSWMWKERATTGTWLPPVYPFKAWVLIGVTLFALQGLAEFVRNVYLLCGREVTKQ